MFVTDTDNRHLEGNQVVIRLGAFISYPLIYSVQSQKACQDLCLLPVCCSLWWQQGDVICVEVRSQLSWSQLTPLKWQTAQAAPTLQSVATSHQPLETQQQPEPVHLICTQRQHQVTSWRIEGL